MKTNIINKISISLINIFSRNEISIEEVNYYSVSVVVILDMRL